MHTFVYHTGVSVLSVVGGSVLTGAVLVNPVGAVMFASGLAWWLYDRYGKARD